MFVGHFGVAFGAKRFAPGVSLGMLFLACQLADLLWPNLVLAGIESFTIQPGDTVLTPLHFIHYPWSHSLLALVLWGLLLAGIYTLLKRGSIRAAWVIFMVVVSHWLLDFLTHRADMPITLNDASAVGLGLWNIPWAAVSLELALFGSGLWLYTRSTRARDRAGRLGLWGVAVFLIVVYVVNLIGPSPPSVAAVAWSAEAMWLLVAIAFWVDRHRIPFARS